MHPPRHVCEQLYRIAPNYRLAWWEGDVNADPEAGGSFVLLELMPLRQVVVNDQVQTIRRLWPMEIDGAGPVFNRWGGTTPDYDRVTQCLVEATPLNKETGYHISDIFGTRFIHLVQRSMMSRAEADRNRRKRLEQMGKDKAKKLSENSLDFADKYKYINPDPTWRPEATPYKMKRDKIAQMEEAGEKAREMNEKSFLRKQGMA